MGLGVATLAVMLVDEGGSEWVTGVDEGSLMVTAESGTRGFWRR